MRQRGPASLLIGIGVEIVLIINPDWLPVFTSFEKNLIAGVGIALFVFGLLLFAYDWTGFSLRLIWYFLKPYGIAAHYQDFLNIGGDVGDLRLVMVIAHFQNRTWRDITRVGGRLVNNATGEELPIFLNLNGGVHPPNQIRFIPKWAKFRVMVPFGPQHGTGINQQDHPPVEEALQRCGDFVLELDFNGWRVLKKFTARKILKEANRVLNRIRMDQQKQNRLSPIKKA